MANTFRSCWGVLSIVTLLLLSGYETAEAAKAHPNACNVCHKAPANQNPRAMGNLCLGTCHVSGGIAETHGAFSTTAASDALDSNPTAGNGNGAQTSHFWGATSTGMPEAGSQHPPTTFYNSRYQISTGLVTCTICHDPHADITTKPKLLRASAADDVLCKQCHMPYYQDFPGANLTHPVGTLVAPTADPLKFTTSVVNSDWGTVQLVNGYVSCTSCHSTHFTDSDSTTEDGLGMALNAGDGRLLRTDGPKTTGATLQQTANKRSAICTACHPYKTHGNDTEPVACLVCHSAHVYNPVGPPNYFVLRNNATTTAFGAVIGLNYSTLGTAQTIWADGSGATAIGYCEKCHGNLISMAGSLRQHTEGENCRICHVHNAAGALRSFEGTGCDGCHGYPPATNVPTTGYAFNATPDPDHNYASDPNTKNEAATPHPTHSGATSSYKFSCSFCHNADFVSTHDQGTFQDVLNGVTFQPAVKPSGSGLAPVYTKTGNGSCASVACHSNGGMRTGDGARTYITTTPVWGGAINSISTCDACHGNDNVDMVGKNSASHIKHLNQGYSCNVCHKDTATSATTLASGAANIKHVNGITDVVFAAGGTYTAASGTCAVSCHGTTTPDWDVAASGACGTCHQYSNAGVATGTGTVLSGAHAKHVYAVSDGVQLACTTCHTNNGSGTDHANGLASLVTNYQFAVCNPCHGAVNGNSTAGNPDRQPVWTNTGSVDCQTCHAGTNVATISGKVAPDKSTATSTGHNLASGSYSLSLNTSAKKVCTSCHDGSAAVGHLDGISSDDTRLNATATTCTTTCHGVGGSAAKKGLVTHQGANCSTCHDPHGSSNLYMVRTDSADYSGTVVFTALSGSNSYDEDDNADGGVSESNADDLCATCHSSTNGVAHNNRQNTDSKAPTGHKLGLDCFTCHRAHTDSSSPFEIGSGTACNDCHGFPPASAAHAEHAKTTSNNKDIEDRSDCAKCHTGANLYTYDLNADDLAGLNHSDVAGRRSLLITSVGYNTTTFSCSTACHKSSASDGYWSDGNGLNCDACHYYAASPSSAANTGDLNPLTGSHGKHFGSGGVTACSDCHAIPNGGAPLAGPLVHITTGAGTDLAVIQGRAEAVMNEAAVVAAALNTGSDPDPGNTTCNNRVCHNPSNTSYIATWTVANAAGCAFCHSTTNPNTGSHNDHMTAAGVFGLNTVACTSCHGTAPTVNTHRNASVNFAAGINYTAGAVDVGGTVGSCTTTTCHNDGKATPTAVATPNWGVDSANCTICHDNAPATGAHAKHANVTFVAGSCNDCHTAANTASHINGSRNTGNKVTSYTVGDGTCANACHLVSNGRDWTSGTKLACTDCHGSGKVTVPALDRKWPPLSGAHLKHTGNASYVASNCVDCHNNNTVTHSTLNNVTTAALGNKISVNPGNGSCTNSCHLSPTANDWTGGAAIFVCIDCHSGTYVGGGAKGPSSGLHTGARITANGHDDVFSDGNAGTATCITCHTTAPSSAHINGVLNASSPTVALTASVGFIDDAVLAPTCAPTGAMSSCHDDNGVWKRKWSASAKNSDGSECANCHGSFTLGFVTGMSLRHQTATNGDTDGEIATSHDGCFMCHGYKPGELFYDFATQHRNGAIEVNDQVGFVDNGSTVGCTGCHSTDNVQTIDEHHGFDDTLTGSGGLSRWDRNPITGPTGSCNDCHVSNGVGHGHGTESVSEHNSHDQSGYTVACTDCHINNGPGPITHNNGTVNFGGTYMNSSLDYARASGFGGTCTGDANGCHNSATGNWATGALSGCADCHSAKTTLSINKLLYQGGYPPTSAKHAEHLANNAYVPNDCTSCHGPNAVTGTHATHKNAVKDTIVNYHAGNNSCDNSCHLTAVGDWLPAGTLDCADCHNATGLTLNQGAWPPVSNAHNEHIGSGTFAAYGDATNHSTTVNYEFGCGSCHGNTSSAHVDGNKTVTGTGWNGTTCNNTYCHSGLNASNVRSYATTPAWTGTFAGDRCAACHGNSPASGAHVEHQIGFHSTAVYTGLKNFLPVLDVDPLPIGLVLGANGRNQLRGHGGLLDSDGTPTSTTISCYICHNDTVTSKFNDQSPVCGNCHNGSAAPLMGNASIADKTKHVNNAADVQFVDEKIRSKAQVRDNLFDVPELSNNWTRNNLYKKNDGSSFDEQPQTLRQMAVANGGWNSVDKSCQISCHLWESGRVDKYPAQWNGGAIICIDCHTRLPK